jgi:hypothetical protein
MRMYLGKHGSTLVPHYARAAPGRLRKTLRGQRARSAASPPTRASASGDFRANASTP